MKNFFIWACVFCLIAVGLYFSKSYRVGYITPTQQSVEDTWSIVLSTGSAEEVVNSILTGLSNIDSGQKEKDAPILTWDSIWTVESISPKFIEFPIIGISINTNAITKDDTKIEEEIHKGAEISETCKSNGNYYIWRLSNTAQNNSYKEYLSIEGLSSTTCRFEGMASTHQNFTIEELKTNELSKIVFEKDWYTYAVRPLMDGYSNNWWIWVEWVIAGRFKNNITTIFIKCPSDLNIAFDDENNPQRVELKIDNHQMFYETYKPYFNKCEEFLRNDMKFVK